MYRSISLFCALLIATVLFNGETIAQKSKTAAKSAAAKADKRSDAKSDKKSAKNDKKTADAKKPNDSKDKKQADARAKDKNKKDKNKKDEAVARKSDDKKSDKKSDKKQSDKRIADAKADKKSKDKREDRDDKRESKKEALAARREREQKEAEERRERERREQERRAAVEAEQRRREQARREAIERARAFERGLRDETVSNILADDTTGEDMDVRRAAINALGKRAGTVVVMDAQNGRVVTAVNQNWAIRKGFKPCSTVKLVTGVAGINEKVINQFGEITTTSSRMDLNDALAYSNNGYFQKVGGSIGYNKMMSYSRELGLGVPTGINMPGESAGQLPEPKNGFALNRMSSHGDDFEVTPIQLATMVTAISNGGKLIKPQVARSQPEKVSFRPTVRRQLTVPQRTLQQVLPGMMGAVNYGTARRANDSSLNIGGKTGSCIGQGTWLGLFASVAPVVNPKYAVVVVTRGQAERGKWAAAVAGKVYQALGSRIRAMNPPQPMIANSQPVIAPPKPKIDAQTAAKISAAEDDTDEEAQADAEGGDFVNGNNAGKSNKFEPRVAPTNPNVRVINTLPTVQDNKVRTINKVYPRGNAPAVNNQNNQPAQNTNPATQQRRPRIVTNQ